MPEENLVNLVIDGRSVQVAKGTNLIEAAAKAGIEIPHYCYHKNLSIAGNCRMCQVQVEGMPKLTIACNTGATEGMVVHTHLTSADVADAQRATLEFLLINHPLDCTVCDQAGHCKLQDYYYEYNSKSSRFTEDKVLKVKAQPLGPEVIYDGERCILCTRCVRFCDEVTQTSELGVLNRGDKSLIAVYPGVELNNPLAGTVVDLCPVGALTHRRWRFNTRIWYTEQTATLCPGCATGCNVKAAVRDNKVVQIKARVNESVNKEWLCDEGRYGFDRFLSEERLLHPQVNIISGQTVASIAPEIATEKYSLGEAGSAIPEHYAKNLVSWEDALSASTELKNRSGERALILLSSHLTLEEVWVALDFAEKVMGITPQSGQIAVAGGQRELSSLQKILISPDYSPNLRAAVLLGMVENSSDWHQHVINRYVVSLDKIIQGKVDTLLLVGDFSLTWSDRVGDEQKKQQLLNALANVPFVVSLCSREGEYQLGQGVSGLSSPKSSILLPTRNILEKNGLYLNKDAILQRVRRLLEPPQGTASEWRVLQRMAQACGVKLNSLEAADDRALSKLMLGSVLKLKGITLHRIGNTGVMVEQ